MSRPSLLALFNAAGRFRLFVNSRVGAEHCAFRLIGWRTVRVTPDMIGRDIAQFVAIEEWSPGKPGLSPEKANFARQVESAGGFAAIGMRFAGRANAEEIREE